MPRILSARRAGFTLLELIVVVTVLGVLAAIAVPTFDRVRQESRDRALEATAAAFVSNVRAIAASDGSGGFVSASHVSSALSELPDGVSYAQPAAGEVVFVLHDRQIVVSAADGAISAAVPSRCAQASGGDSVYDITVDGVEYRVHVFSTTGAATFTTLCSLEAEYLVVAGGGPGGSQYNGGGGGAGGLLTGLVSVASGSYPVAVGAGGVASTPTVGGDSSVFSMTAVGGGRAQPNSGSPATINGGSGAGSSGWSATNFPEPGGSPTPGQGNAGGAAANHTWDATRQAGGGGGGAGTAGGAAAWHAAGAGGYGVESTITGTAVRYAGGGGGYKRSNDTGAVGRDGGGNGASSAGPAQDGQDGLGGGGGGGTNVAGREGGDGGDGVVIVRYRR